MENTAPTRYAALNRLLSELVTGAQAILKSNFTGAYLQGSLAIGDFDEHSDVDFVVVTEDDLTESQLADLGVMHERIHTLGGRYRPDYPAPSRVLDPDHWEVRLEGSYIPRRWLKSWESAGHKHWYKDNGSRVLELSDHDDTLVVRWTLRERGVCLSGPDPKLLIDPIPAHALRREVATTLHKIWDSMDDPWWHNGFGQPFGVLTVCRILYTMETGMIHSKRQSAEWALAHLDLEWAELIQLALCSRWHGLVHQPCDPAAYARTVEFVAYGMRESERVLSGK